MLAQVAEERSFADAGLASKDEHPARTGERIDHKPIERLDFGLTPEESHDRLTTPDAGAPSGQPYTCRPRSTRGHSCEALRGTREFPWCDPGTLLAR